MGGDINVSGINVSGINVSGDVVSGDDGLHRHYRRLLLAYPGWYRRQRGLEMVTTLLDVARPDQRRPTRAEILDVVGRGLWYRFRPPRPGYALLYLPVAVFVALAGSVLAVRLSFAVLAPIPTEDAASTMAEAATGQRPHNVPGAAVACAPTCPITWTPDGDAVFALDIPFDGNGGVDAAMVGYWPPEGERDAMIVRAGTRLAARGWSVQDEVHAYPYPGATLIAERSGWQLRVGHGGSPTPGLDGAMASYPPVYVSVQRSPPTLATGLSVAALLGGLPAGWVLINGVVGCYRQHRAGRRAAILLAGVTAVVFAILTDLVMAWFTLPVLSYVEENVRGPWPLLPAGGSIQKGLP